MTKRICACLAVLVLSLVSAVEERQNQETVLKQVEPTIRTTIGQKATTQKAFAYTSIKEVCDLFGVPKENCSCKLFTVQGTDFDNLCQYSRNNETEVRVIYKPELSIPIGTVALISSILGIFGNGIIIGAVMKIGKNLSRCKEIIGTLAISDFIFSFIQLILSIPLLWTNKWVYGRFLCKFLRGGKITGEFLYIGFVFILTIERFLTIVKKWKKISMVKILIASVINVILALMTVIPLFVIYDVDDNGQCGAIWGNKSRDSALYDWLLTVCYFIVPVTLIIILLAKTKEEINKQTKLAKIDVTSAHCNMADKKVNENQRMFNIIISMLIAYVVCILPNRIVWLYFDYLKDTIDSRIYIILCYIGLITYSILVAVNPVIYFVIDQTWRESMLDIILCRRYRPRLPSKPKPSDDQGFTVKSKTFGPLVDNMKIRKNEKGRNLSVDQGTHLLSYNPSYMAMNKNAIEAEETSVS